MKTIIFIGSNKSGSSREAIRAAVKLGYFTVLFTHKERQLEQRHEYVDVHEMIFIDTTDLPAMKKEIVSLQKKGNDIKTIVSFIDSHVSIALKLCEVFCPNGLSSSTAEVMENKASTRSLLDGLPFSPKFVTITPNEQVDLQTIKTFKGFPLIVKSSSSTGSKDVLRAENLDQLRSHVRKLQEKNEDEAVMIEEFIEGQQYLVEAIVHRKQIHIAGVIEQEITFGKRFIITGYGVLATIPRHLTEGIEKVLQSIVEKFAIENAALHVEMRFVNNEWRLIEINPRISGGAMNNMLQAAFGFNLAEETLKLYLGERPQLEHQHKHFIFTQYVIVQEKGILEKVTGKNRARKMDGVVEVYVKPKKGSLLVPPLSMGHRYAYVIAKGRTMSSAKVIAKKAAKEIQFHLQDH
ncbi:ATP-grasp domain-containing protein [Sporosarcina saromensis]|uniref:ATP-grasp domain-containing protein n=1 Tax=Sporosarcina saromensis TaxID=359365 RepID=A0ABU4GCU2_9BACL|nr:ATP-grasp domain-containing protein [Sporosarcina saromensis]MDW0114809.1 ATP-grasp domain-containing protein [Sporosarcina saromensis]